MGIKIRTAKAKDVSAILEIINYEILNSTVLYDYKERSLAQQLAWFRKKEFLG